MAARPASVFVDIRRFDCRMRYSVVRVNYEGYAEQSGDSMLQLADDLRDRSADVIAILGCMTHKKRVHS